MLLQRLSEIGRPAPKPEPVEEVAGWYKRAKRKLFAKGNENET